MKIDFNLLSNAIQAALREMEKCPCDDVATIWNEQLTAWKTGLKMDDSYELTVDESEINLF